MRNPYFTLFDSVLDSQNKVTAVLTIKQVAARLSLSVSSVYLLIEEGRLAHHRLGVHRGAIRVSEDDLATYVSACRETQAEKRPASPPVARRKLKHIRL